MEALVVLVSAVALVSLAALLFLVDLVPPVVPVSVVFPEPPVGHNRSPCCLQESPEKPIASGAEPRRWSP
jgi:hypothetical protein